jgi:histidine triad (HIT) family protein
VASVFTRIIQGELPSYKVFENDLVLAILALDQVNLGHSLVIPKIEINHWFDVPEKEYIEVHLVAKRLGSAIRQATGAPRVGQIVAGFEVPHYHLHLIPAWSIPELSFSRATKRSDAEMLEIQKKIVSYLI